MSSSTHPLRRLAAGLRERMRTRVHRYRCDVCRASFRTVDRPAATDHCPECGAKRIHPIVID